ncbi:hypothetical protein CcaverHIS002_0205180 [Cutaneotrichosporon cavernicola]|uniref:Uncharacterized protein n=1 Tax=Cutaneotrichosporon cavernicola TaxID=279322 RepID=A0AA48L2J7_9TREE|nr:uncharacterized protein CcaverHIS019_0205150 [Cutaneotrichosporon cavernicola]BEI81358.1 hypothetical protein CcaverHIS002_0205180 [Cutaneotrichosporon cavernicola]BEI89153.1 hypothetical protein CcaverHIS019_0205150 [Cutaneotrichosporon cavernicola]BEI96930.1 hypothetical protein CcaverHIS631_0205190 [Cutaneotrichosporon cavernicola]BEJ04702.1 hypothetical protein CcaverHIS641_0205190 [Cutaneotrichosporon cavernicola]
MIEEAPMLVAYNSRLEEDTQQFEDQRQQWDERRKQYGEEHGAEVARMFDVAYVPLDTTPDPPQPMFASPEEEQAYFSQFVEEWSPNPVGEYVHFPYVPPHKRELEPAAQATREKMVKAITTQKQAGQETAATQKRAPCSPTRQLCKTSGKKKASPKSKPAPPNPARPGLAASKLSIDFTRIVCTLVLLEKGTRHPSLDHVALNRLLTHLAPVIDTSRALPRLFAHQLYIFGLEEKALAINPSSLALFYMAVRKDTMREFFRMTNRQAMNILCPPAYGPGNPRPGSGFGAPAPSAR